MLFASQSVCVCDKVCMGLSWQEIFRKCKWACHEMTFVREILPPLKKTSLWSSVYLIVYLYIFIFHNKYTMAFKIKSAKIFFWNKRTHSDVVVGSTLILAQTGSLQDINRKRKQGVFMPTSCEVTQAPDKGHTGEGQLSVTWRRRG